MGIHRYNEDLFLPELMRFISENNLSQNEHIFLLELAKNYYSNNKFQRCWCEKYKVNYDLLVVMFVNMTSDEFLSNLISSMIGFGNWNCGATS